VPGDEREHVGDSRGAQVRRDAGEDQQRRGVDVVPVLGQALLEVGVEEVGLDVG
jgi:hypothetical protein